MAGCGVEEGEGVWQGTDASSAVAAAAAIARPEGTRRRVLVRSGPLPGTLTLAAPRRAGQRCAMFSGSMSSSRRGGAGLDLPVPVPVARGASGGVASSSTDRGRRRADDELAVSSSDGGVAVAVAMR